MQRRPHSRTPTHCAAVLQTRPQRLPWTPRGPIVSCAQCEMRECCSNSNPGTARTGAPLRAVQPAEQNLEDLVLQVELNAEASGYMVRSCHTGAREMNPAQGTGNRMAM
jgi:hypothetical protein